MTKPADPLLKDALAAELRSGEQANQEGNLGKARVCARRAVGKAIRAYYSSSNTELDTSSAYKTILFMLEDSSAPENVKQRLPAFTQRLAKDAPDQESYWPLEVDLIEEARWIISHLLA